MPKKARKIEKNLDVENVEDTEIFPTFSTSRKKEDFSRENFKKMFLTTPDKEELVNALYDNIYTVIQDSSCKKRSLEMKEKKEMKGKKGNEKSEEKEVRLHDMLCDFSFAYVPVPEESEFHKYDSITAGKVLTSGKFGKIIDSGFFEGNPIITKMNYSTEEDHVVKEVFVNMVIVNQIIEKFDRTFFDDYLVPTYGIFSCPSKEIISKENKIDKYGKKIVCDPEGINNVFIVQKKIEKIKDFFYYISYLSLDEFKFALLKIFDILLMFNFSPYNLTHGDLHTGNILMDFNLKDKNMETLKIWIIDFGRANFTLYNKTYNNPLIESYEKENVALGGIYDFDLLLRAIIQSDYSQTEEISRYCSKKLNEIYDLFIVEEKSTILGFFMWQKKFISLRKALYNTKVEYNQIYELLNVFESAMDDHSRKFAHEHNLKILKEYTYEKIIKEFFSDLYQEDELEETISKIKDKLLPKKRRI